MADGRNSDSEDQGHHATAPGDRVAPSACEDAQDMQASASPEARNLQALGVDGNVLPHAFASSSQSLPTGHPSFTDGFQSWADILPSLDAKSLPPDMLIDRCQLGLLVTGMRLAVGGRSRFIKKLVACGLLKPVADVGRVVGKRNPMGPFAVALPRNGKALVTGQLVFTEDREGGLTVAASSFVWPNLMRALRTQVPDPGPLATNGEDNLIRPEAAGGKELLHLQLAGVVITVDAVVAAIAAAADMDKTDLRGRVWVQQCEVFADHQLPGAVQLVRDMALGVPRGAARLRQRTFADRTGNATVVAWSEGGIVSPERKVYAKRDDVLRTEVVFRNRTAVVAVRNAAGWILRQAPWPNGENAAMELAAVAVGAGPFLDEVEGAAAQWEAPQARTGPDLILALAPLVALAVPAPRDPGTAGRPQGAGVPDCAANVLDCLIHVGSFDARGLHSGHPVVAVLRGMLAQGVLQASPARPRLFTLHPDYETVRRAMASVPSCVEAGQPDEPGCPEAGLTEPTP
jgi:hypothetical protein